MGTPEPVEVEIGSVEGERKALDWERLGKRELWLKSYFTSTEYLPECDEIVKQERLE